MSLERALDLIESRANPYRFVAGTSGTGGTSSNRKGFGANAWRHTGGTILPEFVPPVPSENKEGEVQTWRNASSLAEAKEALAPEASADWRQGAIGSDTLTAFACLLARRREMDRGKRPSDYTAHATCRHCGPIWLWFSGAVPDCPWCWNRAAGRPIPRPVSVHCGDCIHFERIDHPHLGHCAKGEPEAITGMCNMDRRSCERFLPRSEHTHVP